MASITTVRVNQRGPAGPLAASVSIPSDVTTLPDANYPSGTWIYIASFKGFFVLDKTSTDTVDNVEVLAASTGRWLRSTRSPFARVATWYVNKSNTNYTLGSDANLGTTIGAPLENMSEIVRRMGALSTPLQDVHIYLLDTVSTEDVAWTFALRGFSVYVHGLKTVAHSGTVSAVSAPQPAVTGTPVPGPSITADASLAAYVGRGFIGEITSGAFAGCKFYVYKDLGSNQAMVSNFFAYDPTTNPAGAHESLATAPFNYTIWSITRLTGMHSFVGGSGLAADPGPFGLRQGYLLLYNCDSDWLTYPDWVIPPECCIDICAPLPGRQTYLPNCRIGTALATAPGVNLIRNQGLLAGSVMLHTGGRIIDYGSVNYNLGLAQFTENAFYEMHRQSIFTDISIPISLSHGARFWQNLHIYGTGNTSHIYECQPNSGVSWSVGNVKFCAGTSSAFDFKFNGYGLALRTAVPLMDPTTFVLGASTNLTFANLISTFQNSVRDQFTGAYFTGV